MKLNHMHNVFSKKIYVLVITLIITISASFLLVAPVNFSSNPTQPKQVHAQESLTGAIGSGLGQGISACLGNLVTQFIIPQATGKVAGASFITPSGIPSMDVGSMIAQGQNAFTQFVREGCLDAIAYFAAKNVLNKLSEDTLAWVNSGFERFGQSGNSAFVGDLEGFYAGVSDQAYNRFMQDLQQSGPGNPLNGVCEAFQPQIVRSISENYFSQNQNPSAVEPMQFSSSTEIAADNCEQLAESVGTGTVQDFISGEFEQGGWDAFRHTIDNPNANPIGAYLEKNQQLKSRVDQAVNINQEELQRSGGYVSAVACPGTNSTLDPQTQKCEKPSGEMTDPTVTTPGSVVNEQLNRVVGSGQRQLELADEVNEIVGALTDQLIGKITGSGAEEGPGGVFSQAAQESSYTGDVEEYAQQGYSGGFQEDYASSTLANQIETEQNLRSIIQQLPSTNDIDETRIKAEQCLRNNKLSGPGEIQETEELIAQLNALEEAVFPPAQGTREGRSTEDILEQARENPEDPIDTSTTTQSGPSKTDWAGNSLEWSRGEIYGQQQCDEGETKYPITGKGVGNINFSYSNSDNKWLGYVCALNGFDDPTTGSDSIHVDLQPFETFFDRASDFNRGNPNNMATGTETVTADDTENIPANYESYLYESGYQQNVSADKVKIDWTGARFDWNFYNLFADKDQLERINDGLQFWADGSYRYQISGFRGTGGDANRYGAQTCREQTQGAISWIIKPGSDVWIQQKCIEDVKGGAGVGIGGGGDSGQAWTGWAFFNTGETRPAYDTIEGQVNSFQALIEKINTLIGDTNYDDVYTAPEFEEDNLRELKHDLTTIDEDLGPGESISDRQQKLDRRFGRMQPRFHSEEDIEIASEALQELDPDIEGSVMNRLQAIVNENSCQLPDGYEPPVDNTDDGGGEDGGGDGGEDQNSPTIDSFSATRSGPNSNLINVEWSASAAQCNAVNNPNFTAWNTQQLPVTGDRMYPYGEDQALTLVLECQSSSGQTVTQSTAVGPVEN